MDNKNLSDLNELFSLQYNFDKLKVLLSNILSKQNETDKKLKQQENIVQNLFNKEYNSKNKLENSLYNTIEKNNEKEKTISSSSMKTSQNNITLKQTNESTEKKISINKQIPESNNEESNLEKKLFEKLNEQNKLYEELNNKIKNLEESEKIFNLSFKEIKKNQDNIKLENNGLQSNIQDLFENIENINVKISGLNFYDALKNIKANNSDIDITKTLVEELEKKTFQKFSCIDNKFKKNENDIFSIKNDVFNIKNKIENLNEICQMVQKENSNQKNEFIKLKQEINKDINNLIDTQNTNLNDKFDKIQNEISKLNKPSINIENEIKKLNNNINNDNLSQSLYNKISDKVHKIDNNHKENIKELNNKIENISKEIKYLINIETLQIEKDRISQLKGKLDNLLDEFDITKTVVNQNSNSLRLLTNKIEKLNFAIIDGKDNFSTTVSNIKSNKNKNKKDFNEDHYFDNKSFNSFISMYKKDIEKIKKEHENIHKNLNDIYETLSNKIDIKEYKNTKEYLNNVIEDLNNKLENKYLVKFEINKLIRSLQNQIKLIIETMPKENNNFNSTNSNWLLVNKPLGYYCASCENYIGDLSTNENNNTFYRNQTNPINLKDANCGYRIGNGFSRILSRLKIGEEKKKENQNFSDDNNNKTFFSDGEDKFVSLENEILGKNFSNNINETINEKEEENNNPYHSNNINISTLNNNLLKKLPEITKCQTEKSIFKLQKKNKEINQLKPNDEAPKM